MSISWPRVRSLLRKEWRQIFRDPRSRRIVFASPVLQLVLFGYAVNTDVHETAMYVVDHDVSAESRALVDALTAADRFRITGSSNRSADLLHALDRGTARIGIEIPPDFSERLHANDARVQVLLDGTNSNTATIAQGYAARIIQQFGAHYVQQNVPDGIDLRARAWYNPSLESRVYNIPAVVGTILMLMSLLLTALAVVRERELGTLDQLMVSPLTPAELMLGKTLPVAAIALIDLVLVVVVSLLWFDIPFRGSAFALLIASSVYVVAALGIGLFISTVSTTQQEAFMSMFLFFLPAAILSGFMYPVHTMPEFFQALTLLNPLRHFLDIVRGIFLKGEGLLQILPELAALTAMALAITWLAVRRFARYVS